MNPVGYCKSLGYKVKIGHYSTTCTCKKSGHQDMATQTNIMGGRTANKNWVHQQCAIVPPTSIHMPLIQDYLIIYCTNMC